MPRDESPLEHTGNLMPCDPRDLPQNMVGLAASARTRTSDRCSRDNPWRFPTLTAAIRRLILGDVL